MTDLFSQSTQPSTEDPGIPLEAIAPVAVEDPEILIEPDAVAAIPAPAIVEAAVVPMPLMQVLPADFELPALIKFVPDTRLRDAADRACEHALSIQVTGNEGLQQADGALATVRASKKAIEDHFADPVDIANRLHKSLTSARGEWLERIVGAIKVVGDRIYTEQQRLKRIADEERRKAQEEANRQAREEAKREAEAAAKNQAPAQVVQELERRAETAQAPPVSTAAAEPAPLRNTTTTATWKSRIKGTPADDDPNPTIDKLSPAQWDMFKQLLRDIVDDKPGIPRTAIAIDWSVLNGRAKAEKSALNITGIEAFQEGGTRAKPSRGAR